jgi:hypothetical protein
LEDTDGEVSSGYAAAVFHASSIPLPAGLSLDAANGEQTSLVVQQVVVHLLAIIQQQAEQFRTLEVRMAALDPQG